MKTEKEKLKLAEIQATYLDGQHKGACYLEFYELISFLRNLGRSWGIFKKVTSLDSVIIESLKLAKQYTKEITDLDEKYKFSSDLFKLKTANRMFARAHRDLCEEVEYAKRQKRNASAVTGEKTGATGGRTIN